MTTTRQPATRPSRRTLVKGAAWATPVIAMASPVHAQTLSPGSCGTTETGVTSVSRCASFFIILPIRQYTVCFANGCPPGSESVTVSGVTVSWVGGLHTLTGSVTLAPGESDCITGEWFISAASPTEVNVQYSLNGTVAPPETGLTVGPCGSTDRAAQVGPPEGTTVQLEDGRTLTVRGGELVDESGHVIRSEKDLLAPAPEVTSVEPKATPPVETTTKTPAPAEPAAPTSPPAPQPPAQTPAPQPVVDQAEQTAGPSDN